MATQIRDTEFGHLIRFVSGNKLFQYPDEIDPSLWKQSTQRNTSSTPTPSGEQVKDTQGVGLQEIGANNVVENDRDIYLVDWYGPDDPEVCSSTTFRH